MKPPVTFTVKASPLEFLNVLQNVGKDIYRAPMDWQEMDPSLLHSLAGRPVPIPPSALAVSPQMEGQIMELYFGGEVIWLKWVEIAGKLLVTMGTYDTMVTPQFVKLLRHIRNVWPENREAIDEYLNGIEPGTMPKGKGLLLPDFKEKLPQAYWKYVGEKHCRPTNADLAEVLVVDESTVKRRIRDFRKQGGVWPPPRPV
ncbi:MAG: hypothetical protein HY675_17455 [Chloroflexi bacterium]|nr:hypothetical protein [Chloroflexota bacterium]